MPYLQKRNRGVSPFKKTGIAVLIGIFLIVMASVFNIVPWAYQIARPAIWGASKVGDGVSYVFGLLRFGDEYDTVVLLKSYEQSFERAQLQNELLQSENAMLRRELGLRASGTEGDIFAAVLSHPPITPFDTLIVDVHDTRDIAVGDRVFAGENIFIGTVHTISDSSVLVELLSNAERKTEGILIRTETAVVLEGIGGSAFEFIAPESFDVELGDLVVTPGSDRFAIARVVHKQQDDNGSFVTILLEQIINFRTLQWVRIETRG